MLKIIALFMVLLTQVTWADNNDSEYIFPVHKGDSLSHYFSILGIKQLVLFNLLNANSLNYQLNKLKPGQTISIVLDGRLDFKQIRYQISPKKTLIVTKRNKRFLSYLKNPKNKISAITKNWQKYQFSIHRAFFEDGLKAGVPSRLLKKAYWVLSKVTNIDKSVHKGDKFILVSQGKRLLSVHHINQYRRVDSYYHQGKYYNKNGFLTGRSFNIPLKTYKRISSVFSKRRFHPILKEYRGHNGTDYAASTGTPVYASRDGVVRFSRTMRGFGKVVYINHDKKYTTIYAHLSKIHAKTKAGKVVKQGDLLGYVGQTGWATGPHLHFEIRVYNKAKNPKKFIGKSLRKTNYMSFKQLQKYINNINYFIR